MSNVALLKNTDQDWPCTQCGSHNVSIVREDKVNPRLKCNNCNFLFNGQDAKAAEAAGALESSPESLASAEEADSLTLLPHQEPYSEVRERGDNPRTQASPFLTDSSSIPRTPTHVFITKDRLKHEFCGKRELKKVALRWEQEGKYDLYELTPKQSVVKLEIQ